MAKLAASRVAERAASQGINMAGGVGLSKEYPFEKFYRDQKIGQVYEARPTFSCRRLPRRSRANTSDGLKPRDNYTQ